MTDKIRLVITRFLELGITSSVSTLVIALAFAATMTVTLVLFVRQTYIPDYLMALNSTFIGYFFGRLHTIQPDRRQPSRKD